MSGVVQERTHRLAGDHVRPVVQERTLGLAGDHVRAAVQERTLGLAGDHVRAAVQEHTLVVVQDHVRAAVQEHTLEVVQDHVRAAVQERTLEVVRDHVRAVVQERTLGVVRDHARLVPRTAIHQARAPSLVLVRATQGSRVLMEVRVLLVSPASTKSTRAARRASTAGLESTWEHKARHLSQIAWCAPAIPTRPVRAQPPLLARATQDSQDQTAVSAQLVLPASTKSTRAVRRAPTVELERTRRAQELRFPRHVLHVLQTRIHTSLAPPLEIAPATQDSQDQTVVSAQLVLPASTKSTRAVRRALTVGLERTRRAQARRWRQRVFCVRSIRFPGHHRPRVSSARRTLFLWLGVLRKSSVTARAGMRMWRARTPVGSVIPGRGTVSWDARRARSAPSGCTRRLLGRSASRRV